MSRTKQEDAVIAFRRWLRRRYPGIGVVLDPSQRTVIVTSLLTPTAQEMAEAVRKHPHLLRAIPGVSACCFQCLGEKLVEEAMVSA